MLNTPFKFVPATLAICKYPYTGRRGEDAGGSSTARDDVHSITAAIRDLVRKKVMAH